MKRLLLVGLLAVAARAVDVTGVYENLGSVVSAPSAAPQEEVSFRGLAGLEFDLELARALHSATTRVVLTQADDHFTICCRDADGMETWHGRWDRGVGYGVEDGQVKLVYRSSRFPHDGFLFVLTTVGAEKRLLVDVLKIQSNVFGPTGKPIGTFLFSRPIEAPRAGRQLAMAR